MQCSMFMALLLLFISPLAVAAEEHTFENFMLRSPSIISFSQYYQVTGLRVGGLISASSGSTQVKTAGYSVDLSKQNIATGYAQSLIENQLVLAVEFDYQKQKDRAQLVVNTESTEILIRPGFAFQVTPILSLGLVANIFHSTEKNQNFSENTQLLNDNSLEIARYRTLSLGITLHESAWEATLDLRTKNEDDKKPQNMSPQILTFHTRYLSLPNLAFGIRLRQADYAALFDSSSRLYKEQSYGFIAESRLSDQLGAEVGLISINHSRGAKGTDIRQLYFQGHIQLNEGIELGAIIQLESAVDDAVEANVNSYGLFVNSKL